MSFARSIFDDDCDFSLWKRDSPDSNLRHEEVLYSSQILKKTRENASFEKKFFSITNDHLYYKANKNDKHIRGWTSLKWMRVEFTSENSNPSNSGSVNDKTDSDPPYRISLIRNLKLCQIFTNDKRVYKQWYKT